jgi:hypothetical protein
MCHRAEVLLLCQKRLCWGGFSERRALVSAAVRIPVVAALLLFSRVVYIVYAAVAGCMLSGLNLYVTCNHNSTADLCVHCVLRRCVQSQEEDSLIKITDFGLSKVFSPADQTRQNNTFSECCTALWRLVSRALCV